MPELPTVVWLIGGVIALAISCLIAERAGGNRRAGPWGFLGPLGWIIAAVRGVQERMDAEPKDDLDR